MSSLGDFRAAFLPYCIQKQKNGSYVVLNREYKPVGFNTTEWIDYDKYPVEAYIKGLSPSVVKKISCEAEIEPDCIYLYSDGTNPLLSKTNMDSYLIKLAILAKLRFEK